MICTVSRKRRRAYCIVCHYQFVPAVTTFVMTSQCPSTSLYFTSLNKLQINAELYSCSERRQYDDGK